MDAAGDDLTEPNLYFAPQEQNANESLPVYRGNPLHPALSWVRMKRKNFPVNELKISVFQLSLRLKPYYNDKVYLRRFGYEDFGY